MKTNNVIREKTFKFAVRIVNLYKYLYEKKEFVISKQLLRCGTSIGANIEEAIGGQSEKDFFTKITIAYKETRETAYWLKLLFATDYFNKRQFSDIYEDINEISKILSKIQTTMKKKLNS